MIKNVIFDIGNVLVEFCWRDHIAGCGFSGDVAQRIGKAMMQNPDWNEIDRGVWSQQELLDAFIENDPEIEEEIRKTFADLSTIIRMYPGSAAWIRSLKEKGYSVYYLSNFSGRIRRECEKELGFMQEMDGGIMSYTVQQIKPDEDIYRTLFDRYNLMPEECVFLDDSLKNLETARRLGMRTILVKSPEQAREELDILLNTAGL